METNHYVIFFFLVIILGLTLITACPPIPPIPPTPTTTETPEPTLTGSFGYLCQVMDMFHGSLDVYTDSDAAGNHFAARGRMSGSPETAVAIPPMVETCVDQAHSGIDCIKCTFQSLGQNWGGWYFINGILQGTESTPKENWGDTPNAGIDLQGATKITFWARGYRGGENIEFMALGVGKDPNTGVPIKQFPDSSAKVSTGYVTLTVDWKQYTIDLQGKDLSYVLGGFGWITSAQNNNNENVTFYLDDIRYDKSRLEEPRFLVSFKTIRSDKDFDFVSRNVAFTYDNAVALIAFLAMDDYSRAGLLADALVYAQQHDRYYDDGRIRNAYQGGDLILPPGWTPNGKTNTVRMPGWYDSTKSEWLEDEYDVSTTAGNVAWTMLALLDYYECNGGSKYLNSIEQMGEWVEANCRDERGNGGYTGGFEGWEPNPTKILYKATEHNIDLYAAFQRLYLITKRDTWRERADHAKQFVVSMWDQTEGKFWTGTGIDGVTTNKDTIPVDIQAWALLSLLDEGTPYLSSLSYAESHHKVGNGYDFNQDLDGIWNEGSAHMAVAYGKTGNQPKSNEIINFLKSAQDSSGGLNAADRDGLTTGFLLPDGNPWLYFKRLHVGATAWMVLAEKGANPFWMESSGTPSPTITPTPEPTDSPTPETPPPTASPTSPTILNIYNDAGMSGNDCFTWSAGNIGSFNGRFQDAGAPEGTQTFETKTNTGTWAGWGVVYNAPIDLSDYNNGYLVFWLKSSSNIKIEIETGTNKYTKYSTQYGYPNDNVWREISIPLSDFTGSSLTNIRFPFESTIEIQGTFYVDDVRWTKADVTPNPTIDETPVPTPEITQIPASPEQGVCWVAESFQNRVVKLSPDGNILLSIQTGDNHPECVCVDPNDGSCWVSVGIIGPAQGYIMKLASDGTELFRINGKRGQDMAIDPNDGSCWGPGINKYNSSGEIIKTIDNLYATAFSVNPLDGSCWIAEEYKNRIIKYSRDCEIILSLDNFDRPYDVSIDPTDGSCWVCDSYNVTKLSSDGIEIFKLSGFNAPYVSSVNKTDSSCWVADFNVRIVNISKEGNILHSTYGFMCPESVSVNNVDGSCWVGDTDYNRVTKIAANGTKLFNVDFNGPYSVSVNSGL